MQTPHHQPKSPGRGARTALSARFWNLPCWLHQQVITHYSDAVQPLPGRTQLHVGRCPACREFHAVQTALTQRLGAESKSQGYSPSPFLHARIMASLNDPGPADSRPQPIFRPIWAAALALICVGAFAFPFFRSQPASKPGPNQQFSTAPPSIRQATGGLPESLNRHLIEFSKTVNQPLETEMNSVVTDAKAAIQLLAANFLPKE